MRKFNLFHFALYAKGFYKRFNPHSKSKHKTLYDDLKVILTLDDYMGEYMSPHDMRTIILDHCQSINKPVFNDINIILNGISPLECWKYGYYTNKCTWIKDHNTLPEYDMNMAIIMYCISNLKFTTPEELGTDILPLPDYKKGLPKRNGVKNKCFIKK